MKHIPLQIKRASRLLLQLSLILFLTNCSNLDNTLTTDIEEEGEAIPVTDGWICDIESFEDEAWRYELYLKDNGDYIAVSDSRILKVSKDGILSSIIMLTYPDDNSDVIRIYNEKIYRFHYDNDFQVFDPNQAIELHIYDFDFNLLSDHILDTKGLIYDVEVENDDVFGMLVYTPNNNTMTLKKLSISNGLLADIVLSTSGTSPRNLHIAESGDYFCTTSSNKNNFTYLDNDLNLMWANEFEDYLIADAKYIAGQGVFISGRMSTFVNPDRHTFVALIDTDGNELNSVTFDAGERWSPYMEVNDDRICLVQTEPETGLNMLYSIIDFNFNIESTIEIEGSIVQSDIIVNELGSFSFVYGSAIDEDDPSTFPASNTRIFKFDESYDLPTNIIVQ